MGKTKTAFVGGTDTQSDLSGAEKYKQKQAKKAQEEAKKQVEGLGLKGGERIKFVGGEVPEEESETAKKAPTPTQKGKRQKTRGNKYQKAYAKIDKNKTYDLDEAIKAVKETSYSHFDGTLELHLIAKKTGLSVNLTLPYSTGKSKKIEIADEKTLEKLTNGKIDFDVLLSTPDMMPKLVPFARILGPKGLMPNPKNGTIIKKAEDAKKFSVDKITIKTEKDFPLIHTVAGKLSMEDAKLEKNLEAILEAVGKKQIVKAYLKATMGPSVKIVV